MTEATLEVGLAYDESTRSALFTFPSGKTLKLSNCDRARVERFLAEHCGEFAKRDLMMTTPGVAMTRGGEGG